MEIIAKVISQKGTCEAGHRVGDELIIGQTTPANMCPWAFYTVFPSAKVLEFGGSFPWRVTRIKPGWSVPTRTTR